MQYEYKCVTFGCGFLTKKAFDEKLQSLLDEYSKNGWRLHSCELSGSAGLCVVIFEKDID